VTRGKITTESECRIGSSFDDFLKEDGICEEVTARAEKRVIARRVRAETKRRHGHRIARFERNS
jgi:hypothetical protein